MSQRHRVENYGYAANGEPEASGIVGRPLKEKREKERKDREKEERRRPFPLGPFNILRIDPSTDPAGVYYVVSATDAGKILQGDLVEVIATGDNDTNGEFTIDMNKSAPGEIGFFRPNVNQQTAIVGRGRLRVLGNGNLEE